MKTYRADQHRIDKPSKLIELPDGYDVTSNDGTIKMMLHRCVARQEAMESDFYSTTMWIKEGNGWTKVRNSQSYRTKEDFIDALSKVEEFSQAISEYKFNNQNNNEL